jgi:hypothetical protein
MERIGPGKVVKHTGNGRLGVTVPDFMDCCFDEETPVAWTGEESFAGTNTDELRVLYDENPIAEPGPCGAGLRADCCIFLTLGSAGFACERHTARRYQLQFKKQIMSAQREPTEPYPLCKKFGGKL